MMLGVIFGAAGTAFVTVGTPLCRGLWMQWRARGANRV